MTNTTISFVFYFILMSIINQKILPQAHCEIPDIFTSLILCIINRRRSHELLGHRPSSGEPGESGQITERAQYGW